MINAKKIYNVLLNNESITALVDPSNILNAYPEIIQDFPCVVFLDEKQRDTEFSDNMPMASDCTVQIHIFSKKVAGFPTSAEIGMKVAKVMNDDWWTCSMNGETPDMIDYIDHRVMRFSKSILC